MQEALYPLPYSVRLSITKVKRHANDARNTIDDCHDFEKHLTEFDTRNAALEGDFCRVAQSVDLLLNLFGFFHADVLNELWS